MAASRTLPQPAGEMDLAAARFLLALGADKHTTAVRRMHGAWIVLMMQTAAESKLARNAAKPRPPMRRNAISKRLGKAGTDDLRRTDMDAAISTGHSSSPTLPPSPSPPVLAPSPSSPPPPTRPPPPLPMKMRRKPVPI